MADALRRLPYVLDRTGAKRSTIYNWIQAGLWPAAIVVGPRMTMWVESEIDALVRARIAGKSDEQIRALVADLVARRQEDVHEARG
ncbi:MAG: AlpA family phage regulatory protein [Thermoanaerobaculia bacterium]